MDFIKQRKWTILIIGIVIIGYFAFNRFFYYGELVGIKGTNTYHRDNCLFVKKASSSSIVFLANKTEAAEKNYRPCKTCNPPDNSKELTALKNTIKNTETKNNATPYKWTANDFK